MRDHLGAQNIRPTLYCLLIVDQQDLYKGVYLDIVRKIGGLDYAFPPCNPCNTTNSDIAIHYEHASKISCLSPTQGLKLRYETGVGTP